jgi:hypothetical protein
MNTKLDDSAFLEDLNELEHILRKVSIYRKAVIYGIRFKSHGVEFSESKDPNALKMRWGSDQRYTVFQSVILSVFYCFLVCLPPFISSLFAFCILLLASCSLLLF